MKAILAFIGFAILVANLAAIGAGTRQGIGGMLTIDVLCVVAIGFVGTVWLARRMIDRAQTGAMLSERVQNTAVDVGALGLRATRRLNQAATDFADHVRERAVEKLK